MPRLDQRPTGGCCYSWCFGPLPRRSVGGSTTTPMAIQPTGQPPGVRIHPPPRSLPQRILCSRWHRSFRPPARSWPECSRNSAEFRLPRFGSSATCRCATISLVCAGGRQFFPSEQRQHFRRTIRGAADVGPGLGQVAASVALGRRPASIPPWRNRNHPTE